MPALPRSSSAGSTSSLSPDAWQRLEAVLERFEDAWRRGDRPAIDDFLSHAQGLTEQSALLIELVHEDLEFRIKAGEPARVEPYLQRYATLARDRAVVLDLIAAEHALRPPCEADLAAEYRRRFPDYAEELQTLLQRPLEPKAKDQGDRPTVELPGEGAATHGAPPVPGPDDPGCLPQVPGYEVLEELGRGAMGVVYKAHQVELNRLVALKMILNASHAGAVQRKRFRAEAEAAARLQHPHVVQIHDIGEHHGLIYFSQELCPGGTLAQKLAGKPLPIAEAALLAEKLARALQAAHQAGLIHRDLKPANILLDAHGQPKIADFGLAKSLNAVDRGQTQSGAIVGTPSYMAPEQARGQVHGLSPALDVYSLGAILYELLTGRAPFQAATTLETLDQVLTQDPVPPRRLRSQCPRDLETICLKCLRKEPAKRYSTAAALADELVRFRTGEPIHARPIGRLERLGKWARRRPASAALVVLAVVAAASLAGLGAWFTHQVRGERDLAEDARRDADLRALSEGEARKLAQEQTHRAEEQSRRAETLLADMHTASGLVAAERGEPALAALWFASAAGLGDPDGHRARANRLRFKLWSRALPQPTAAFVQPWSEKDVPVPGVEASWRGTVSQLLPHPDGVHLLARLATTRRWVLWNAVAGTPVALPSAGKDVSAAAWSGRGDRIALGTAAGDCLVRRFPRFISGHDLPPGKPVTELQFSRDGRWLAVARGKQVRVWDADRQRFLGNPLAFPAEVRWLVFDGRGTRLAVASADDAVHVYHIDPASAAVEPVAGPLANAPASYHFHSHLAPVWVDDDRALLTRSPASEVAWWDAATGKEVRRLRPNLWSVDAIVPSPDGMHVAVTGWFGCQLYQAHSGVPIGLPLKHTNRVPCAAFSPNGQWLLTASTDQSIKRWSVPGGQLAGSTWQLSNEAYATAFLGEKMAAAQIDGLIRVWQPGSPVLPYRVLPIPLHKWNGDTLVGPEGRYLLARALADGVRVIDLTSEKYVGKMLAGIGTAFHCAFLPHSSRVVIGTSRTVRAWDWRTGLTVWGPIDLPSQGFSLAASPDGRRIVSLCADRGMLLDSATGKAVARFVHEGKPDLVNNHPTVRFSPDGASFVTFGSWHTVTVWDAVTARPRFSPLLHAQRTTATAFSPDGRFLATGSDDNTARVFDLATGRELAKLPHTHWVFNVAFSPDGGRLLTANRDGSARLWDWRTGTRLCPPMPQGNEMPNACFVPGSLWLVGMTGGTVQVWDSVRGKPITPHLAKGWGRGLRLVLGGRKMMAFAERGNARIFDLSPLNDDNPHRLSAQQLRLLAEVRSLHTLQEEGTVRLTTAEWLDRWRKLSPEQRQPAPMQPSPGDDDRNLLESALLAGDDAAAVDHLGRLLLRAPWDASLHVQAAHVLTRLGRNQEAAMHLAQALLLQPRVSLWPIDPDAAQRGERAAQAGNWTVAVRELQIAAHQPQTTTTNLRDLLLAQTAAADADVQRTLTVFASRVQREKNPQVGLLLLQQALVVPWDQAVAQTLLGCTRRELARQRNAATLHCHGAALYRAGKYTEAEQALAESVKLHAAGGFVDTWLFLAMTARQLGRLDEAGRLLARVEQWQKSQALPGWQNRVWWTTLSAEARRLIHTPPAMRKLAADD